MLLCGPRRWLCGLALVVAAGAIGRPARADTVVLYGPGPASPDAEARALATYRLLAAGSVGSPSVRHVDTVLGDLPAVTVLGDHAEVRCTGTSVSVDAFRDGLEQAFNELAYVRLDDAANTLTRLDAMLPCLAGEVERAEIARVGFLQGVGAAYAGREDVATEAFRRALIVSPELQWDPTFPPSSGAQFEAAMRQAMASGSSALTITPAAQGAAQMWLDGMAVGAGGTAQDLGEGRHLVQWRAGDGTFHTHLLEVAAGGALAIVGRSDVAAACLDGTGAAAPLAAELLSTLARENGASVHLASLGDVDLLHTFDAEAGSWGLTDEGMVVARRRARTRTRVGTAAMLTGATVAVLGAVLGATAADRAGEMREPAALAAVATHDQFETACATYAGYREQAYGGYAVAGAGGAVFAAGLALVASGQRGTPTMDPRSGSTRRAERPGAAGWSGVLRW